MLHNFEKQGLFSYSERFSLKSLEISFDWIFKSKLLFKNQQTENVQLGFTKDLLNYQQKFTSMHLRGAMFVYVRVSSLLQKTYGIML